MIGIERQLARFKNAHPDEEAGARAALGKLPQAQAAQ
jgi:hypothetical protein